MTKEEFERGYAERSGTTIEELNELGQYAEPCACGEDGCEGWQMVREGVARSVAHLGEGLRKTQRAMLRSKRLRGNVRAAG